MLLVFLGINYFAEYAVALNNNVLIVKNLYGITIKKLDLGLPFKRKFITALKHTMEVLYGSYSAKNTQPGLTLNLLRQKEMFI